MAEIEARTKGGGRVSVIVDDEDYERLARFAWRLLPSGYVTRRIKQRGIRRSLYLHREVLGSVHGDLSRVAHANGDKGDNRKANLLVRSVLAAPPHALPDGGGEVWQPEGTEATRRSGTRHARHAVPADG